MLGRAETFIDKRLVPPLLHGDEQHQEWLAAELRKWIPELTELINSAYLEGFQDGVEAP